MAHYHKPHTYHMELEDAVNKLIKTANKHYIDSEEFRSAYLHLLSVENKWLKQSQVKRRLRL